MNIGEDDLFIQSIVTRRNVSVIMNPHATIRETQYGDSNGGAQSEKYRPTPSDTIHYRYDSKPLSSYGPVHYCL